MTNNLSIQKSLNSSTLASCVDQAQNFIIANNPGSLGNLLPVNDEQRRFANLQPHLSQPGKFFGKMRPEHLMEKYGLKYAAVIDQDSEVVNLAMRELGFHNISLSPAETEGGFCVASAIDYKTSWKSPGEKSTFSNMSKKHIPAFELSCDINNKLFELNGKHIARLENENNFVVWIIESNSGGLDMLEELNAFKENIGILKLAYKYDSMIFPVMDNNAVIDINWLKGLKFEAYPKNYFIAEARQELSFKMDEKGSSGNAGTSMRIEKESFKIAPDIFEFDHNFIYAVEYPEIGWVFEVSVESLNFKFWLM